MYFVHVLITYNSAGYCWLLVNTLVMVRTLAAF